MTVDHVVANQRQTAWGTGQLSMTWLRVASWLHGGRGVALACLCGCACGRLQQTVIIANTRNLVRQPCVAQPSPCCLDPRPNQWDICVSFLGKKIYTCMSAKLAIAAVSADS